MKPALVLLMTTLVGFGQSIEPPKYEVASIKPNTDNGFRFAFRIEPRGSLAATGITLKRLLMTAYNVQGFRIVGVLIGWVPDDGTCKRGPTEWCHRTKFGQCSELYSKTGFNFVPIQKNGSCRSMNSALTARVRRFRE